MERRGSRSVSARNEMRASLAASSTGGAATRIRIAPPRTPPISVFFARGTTGTSISQPVGVPLITTLKELLSVAGLQLAANLGPGERRFLGHRRRLFPPRTMEQEALLAVADFLFADVLERVLQRVDDRLDRHF